MSKLLAIDTSAEFCSIAVSISDEIIEFHQHLPKQHSKLLLSEIHNLLEAAGVKGEELSAIAFGRGPGSFTGVRIAASVAQGLGFGWDKLLIPVSTLSVLAYSAFKSSQFNYCLPAMDARMDEVYWGPVAFHEDGRIKSVNSEQVLKPEKLKWLPEFSDAVTYGNGWRYQSNMPSEFRKMTVGNVDMQQVRARDMIEFISINNPPQCNPAEAVPIYIRDKVTWDNKPAIGS